MDCSYIPIVDFYKHCLPAAKENGYRYVMCLLSREADIDNLYENLKKQWHSLDDLTGKDFLFMFAGKYQAHDYDSFIKHDVKYGDYGRTNYALANEHISVMSKGKSLQFTVNKDERRQHWKGRYRPDMPYNFEERENRGRYTDELPETQTRAITDLKNYFSLSEYDIPCIVFTNLYNGQNTVLRFNNENLYSVVKNICLELERLFSTIDALAEEVEKYKNLKQSRYYDNHIKIQRYYSELMELTEILADEPRRKLHDCMKTLTFGDEFFGNVVCRILNPYVKLSKENEGVDIEAIEKLIKNEEPGHSHENMNRLYRRADEIIANA